MFKKLIVAGLAAAVGRGAAVEPVVGPKVALEVQQELQGMSEMLARYGVVVGADTKANVSVAVGEGIVHAVVHQEATFVVTAVGYDGNPRTEGGDAVAVTFGPAQVEGGGGAAAGGVAGDVEAPPSKRRKKSKAAASKQKQPAPAAAPVVGAVVDAGNGTYRCSYTPPAAAAGGGARWQLSVQIGGVHVAGSPFAVAVSATKDQEFVFEKVTQGGDGTASSFGEGGVLHYIGTNERTTPFAQDQLAPAGVRAAMSSVGHGSSPDRFLLHAHDGAANNYTSSTPNSWMSVDLGQGRRLAPTHYCLRHGVHSGSYRLLQWRFEGSTDGANWTVLREHTHTKADCPFPDHGFSVAAFPVGPPAAAAGGGGGGAAGGFRHFRIIQTGKNSNGYDHLHCAGIELYGVLAASA